MAGAIFTVGDAKRIGRVVRAVEGSKAYKVAGQIGIARHIRVPNPMFAVKVWIDGGSAGSAVTTCSFTYTVKVLSENATLGTAMTPKVRRIPNTPYTSTPDGTIGQGYFDEAGDFQLYDANETVDPFVCPPDPGGDS